MFKQMMVESEKRYGFGENHSAQMGVPLQNNTNLSVSVDQSRRQSRSLPA
jgi:hypothetical protein